MGPDALVWAGERPVPPNFARPGRSRAPVPTQALPARRPFQLHRLGYGCFPVTNCLQRRLQHVEGLLHLVELLSNHLALGDEVGGGEAKRRLGLVVEEGEKLVILLLRDRVVLVVVAARAADRDAEEDSADRIGDVVQDLLPAQAQVAATPSTCWLPEARASINFRG